MSHPIFHIEVEYENANGDSAYVNANFEKPEAAYNWMQGIEEQIYDEEKTERKIEERGNDIMFTNSEDEARYQLKHA